jgi:N6-L-threonylcarbamoyladenine synthase
MNILGIETSCDETAAAVVRDGRLVRSNVISSQIELHRVHGGVVPELAARAQITAIVPVVEEALRVAETDLDGVDAIAVTQGPGLSGSLLVGVNAAKALAYARDLPLIPINHLEAHVYANWLQVPGDETLLPAFPALCLLVSGGHTELLLLADHDHYQLLGQTLDDAAGEAFDKGARLMGLGYPGGPAIQRASEGGDRKAFALPRAWLGEASDDFSFSGLKTALLRVVEPYRLPDAGPAPESDGPFPKHLPPVFRDDLPIADLAASFEEAIVEVLAVKAARAAKRHNAKSVLLAGGVAANRALRERLTREVEAAFTGGATPPVKWPRIALCTDNGAMVAGLAYHRFDPRATRDLRVDAYPRFPIAAAQAEGVSGS